MANRATDIISLGHAKTELRLVGESAEHDALIASANIAAVEWVDGQTKCRFLARKIRLSYRDLRRTAPDLIVSDRVTV